MYFLVTAQYIIFIVHMLVENQESRYDGSRNLINIFELFPRFPTCCVCTSQRHSRDLIVFCQNIWKDLYEISYESRIEIKYYVMSYLPCSSSSLRNSSSTSIFLRCSIIAVLSVSVLLLAPHSLFAQIVCPRTVQQRGW